MFISVPGRKDQNELAERTICVPPFVLSPTKAALIFPLCRKTTPSPGTGMHLEGTEPLIY